MLKFGSRTHPLERTVGAHSHPWIWLFKSTRRYRGTQIGAALCMVTGGLTSIMDPLVLKHIVDRSLSGAHWTSINTSLLILIGLYLTRLTLQYYGGILAASTLQRFLVAHRTRCMSNVLRQQPSYFDIHPVGELVRCVDRDIEQAGSLASELAPMLFRIVVLTVGSIAILITIDLQLATLVLASLLIFFTVRYRFRSGLDASAERTRVIAGQQSSFSTEILTGALQIQLLAKERAFNRRYTQLVTEGARTMMQQKHVELFYHIATLGLLALVTVAVIGLGAWKVYSRELTIGGYVAFYSYMTRLFEPVGAAIEIYTRMRVATASIRRIRNIEESKPPAALNTSSKPLQSTPDLRRSAVMCRNVTFGYPGADNPTIRDLSLDIARGDKVAVLGASGSGKSTLAKLLVRVYDPQSGTIAIDGQALADLPPKYVRNCVTLVPQSPFVFRGAISENVTLGNESTLERLELLARVTCFDEVLAKLPERWSHVLGAMGEGLSGGERQRLVLLRALLQDRPVLILDEATSAMDPDLESEVLRRLKDYAREKTVLIISHRRSAALWADRFIVIEEGRAMIQREPARNDPLRALATGLDPKYTYVPATTVGVVVNSMQGRIS